MNNDLCSVCEKEIFETDKGIGCDHSKKWIHHKCNELSDFDFKYLQNNKDFWYCIKCIPQVFLFCTNRMNQTNITSKTKPALLNLINQLNDYSDEQNNESNQDMLDGK